MTTISEKTKVQLTIGSTIASVMGIISTVLAVLMFLGIVPIPGNVSGQDCDTIKICVDGKYITKEKLEDSIKLFEKDIDYLKRGEMEQKEMNKEFKESLQTITNLLIQIKRDSN